jgi:uncharacterized protein (TIGR02231 family)
MWKRYAFFIGLAAVPVVFLSLRGGAAEPVVTPAPAKTAANRIAHVTVYPNSALVTREVEVPAGAGTFELVVTPLPPQTVNSSLYSEGGDGIRVLTTRFRTRPIKEDTREEVRKLDDEIRKLQFSIEEVQAQIQTIEMNMKMVGKLEDFTSVNTKTATEKANLNSESVIALSEHVMKTREVKSKELVGLRQQLLVKQEQLEFEKRKREELAAGTSRVERDAVIVVDKANGAGGKIRLNYLVDAAAWRPQYKFRAGKDEKGNVQIEYLAAVVQQTGEDWRDAHVTLSTAAPTLNAAPPDLAMLQVSVAPRGTAQPMPPGVANNSKGDFDQQARNYRNQGQQELIQKQPGNANKFYNDAAALEATWQLLYSSREEMHAIAKARAGRGSGDEGPSVTYHIERPLSVPSRPDEQVIEVARLDMEPEYFYKTVPVLAAHVYRQANLTNSSNYVLLPGEATMYQGTDFVGRMNLPLVAIGEQFTIGLGVDPQLQVQRVMMDKNRTTEGGNQVLRFEYRILVSSYKPAPVTVQVWDRLPHAEKEAVGINLLKTAPELSKDALYVRENRPQNLLRWDLKVEPTMNGEKALAVNYEFQMALDKQMTIGGFQSK